MENSIEENIKEIECFFKRNYFVNYDWTTIHRNSMANLEDSIEDILSDYKRVLKENEQLRTEVNSLKKENEGLKEYIAIAPNLDEMTAIKYKNIQQEAYIQGRAEEQQKAGQIIYENYIPIQKVKDKIEKHKNMCISNVNSYENYFKDNYNELVFRRMEQLEKELLEKE